MSLPTDRSPLTDQDVSVEDFVRLMERRAGRLDRPMRGLEVAMMLGLIWQALRGEKPTAPSKEGR